VSFFSATVSGGKEQLQKPAAQPFEAALILPIVPTLVVGEQGRGVGAVIQLLGIYDAQTASERVNEATLFLKLRCLSRQITSHRCKKHEIVAEGYAGALPSAFTHGSAEAAVIGAVAFVVPHPQIGLMRLYVTEHESFSLRLYPYYHTSFLCKMQVVFVNDSKN
jgi:hypothetical protein